MMRAHLRRLPAMHLIFDFDGTITTADTIGHLASAAVAAQNHRRGVDLQPAWDALVRAYLADYDAYAANFPARTTLAHEKRFLAGLRDVERASLRRVGEAGLFTGLDAPAMRSIGTDAVRNGAVTLRPGFSRIVRVARDKGWPVSVVSVNWSAEFIRGAGDGVLRAEDAVVSNSTHAEDGVICGPGELEGELLVCAPDKVRAMRGLSGGEAVGEEVYFGDSTTDLECLLEARRGVVLADGDGGGSLLVTLRRLGFNVPHVGEEVEGDKRLGWARDFDEVLDSGFLGK